MRVVGAAVRHCHGRVERLSLWAWIVSWQRQFCYPIATATVTTIVLVVVSVTVYVVGIIVIVFVLLYGSGSSSA